MYEGIDCMIDLLKNRRSVRKYKDSPIEKDILNQILKCALLAPSSMNKKPVEIIVVDDKEVIAKLEQCKNMGTLGLKTAPIALAIIANAEVSDVWVEDASIVTTIIQLEAEAQGLGSCWIQMRKRQSETGDSEADVRDALNIPDKYGVLAILSLGYKDEDKKPYDESDFDFSKVHYNKF